MVIGAPSNWPKIARPLLAPRSNANRFLMVSCPFRFGSADGRAGLFVLDLLPGRVGQVGGQRGVLGLEAGRLARERIESAERSDKLPDDAFFDFDPDFMDGMP